MIDKNFSNYKKILLLGAAGIGMSSLAVHLKNLNLDISAYDDIPNQRYKDLQKYNINVLEKINTDEYDLIIRTLAISKDHKYIKDYKGDLISYPEALGLLTKNYKLVAISGTHGKTTTTAMVCKILKDNNIEFNALVGSGLIEEDNHNFVINKNSDLFVIEACEYQDGFLNYTPDTLAITNLEHEHFDAYPTTESYIESFQKLVNQTKFNLILNSECRLSKKLKIPTHLNVSYFNKITPNKLNMQIAHNNLNGNCAILTSKKVKESNNYEYSLSNFKGTQRRQEIIYNKEVTIIDDYAHHPTEIASTLKSIEKIYKNKKIILFYQPHQIDRTEKLLDEFAISLHRNYEVIIPNIYKARDEKLKDATKLGQELAFKIGNAKYIGDLETTKQQFEKLTVGKNLIIIMGAGDILNILPEKYKN